jgi:hypothetical protein
MSREPRRISRRTFLKRAAALSLGVVSSRYAYGILDTLPGVRPARASAMAEVRRREQYLVEGLEVITDNTAVVIIPPLYHEVITAALDVDPNPVALYDAQARLEQALRVVEAPYPPTPVGLTIVVGWGLPYFRAYLPVALVDAYLPVDLPFSAQTGTRQYTVLDAFKFPSDPDEVRLESNDVMFLMHSDDPAILAAAESALFEDPSNNAFVGDLFNLTSVRKGFIGRGFGTPSVAKQLALAAGVPGADQIPDKAPMMLGFTSTHQAALAPDNFVNFETLPGVTDQWPDGYFAGGCAMHLSHMTQDILLWYTSFDYPTRVARVHSPRASAQPGDVTLPNDASQLTSMAQLLQDAADGLLGHNATIQQANRITASGGVTDNYGRHWPAGTSISLRDDFETLDNPFAWSSRPDVDQWSAVPAPGLHFVGFTATSSQFHAIRLAMDGVLPDGTDLRQSPYSIPDSANGLNGVIRMTHMQNYLIPPRERRSFPLVELHPGLYRQFLPLVMTNG